MATSCRWPAMRLTHHKGNLLRLLTTFGLVSLVSLTTACYGFIWTVSAFSDPDVPFWIPFGNCLLFLPLYRTLVFGTKVMQMVWGQFSADSKKIAFGTLHLKVLETITFESCFGCFQCLFVGFNYLYVNGVDLDLDYFGIFFGGFIARFSLILLGLVFSRELDNVGALRSSSMRLA